eukprot:ctg_4853.g432
MGVEAGERVGAMDAATADEGGSVVHQRAQHQLLLQRQTADSVDGRRYAALVGQRARH